MAPPSRTVGAVGLLLLQLLAASVAVSARGSLASHGSAAAAASWGHPSLASLWNKLTAAAGAAEEEVMVRGTTLCIPKAASLIEEHEGRHQCAYDHEQGYRAVGFGYNLDDNPEIRRRELENLFLDYDKVYKGEQCLNAIQLTTLSALEARRSLNAAAEEVPALNDWCCSIQAAFADITFSSGTKLLRSEDFEPVVDKALTRDWRNAAQELRHSRWCQKNKERCEHLEEIIRQGCGESETGAVKSVV